MKKINVCYIEQIHQRKVHLLNCNGLFEGSDNEETSKNKKNMTRKLQIWVQ